MCPPNRAFSERLAGVQRAAPRGLARRRHRKPSVVAPPPVVVTLHQSWGGRRAIRALEPPVLPGRRHLPTVWALPAEAAGVFRLSVSQVLQMCPWQQQKEMFEKNKMK